MLITHRLINKDNERYLSLYLGEQNLLIKVDESDGKVRATNDRLCFNPSNDIWYLVPLSEQDASWLPYLQQPNTSAMVMAMIAYEICNHMWERHEAHCGVMSTSASMVSIAICKVIGGEHVALLQLLKRNGELTANVSPKIDVPDNRKDVAWLQATTAKTPADILAIAAAITFWKDYEWLDEAFPSIAYNEGFPKETEGKSTPVDEPELNGSEQPHNAPNFDKEWLELHLCQYRLKAPNPPIDAPLLGVGTEFRETQHNDGSFTFTVGMSQVKWNADESKFDNAHIGHDNVTFKVLGDNSMVVHNRLVLGEQLILNRLKALLDEADTNYRYTYVPETVSLVAYPMYSRDNGRPFYHIVTHWYTRYEFCFVCVGMWTDTETFQTEVVHTSRVPSPVFMLSHMKLLGDCDV